MYGDWREWLTWNQARLRQVAAVASILLFLAGAGVWLAKSSDSVVTGGPVIVLGIDAEDGGVGAHGPVATYAGVLSSMLGNVLNGGAGILVIGGGKFPGPPPLQDDVSAFFQAVDAALPSASMVYINGAAAISAASFNGFAMIAVVSSEAETSSGGLTDDENTALIGRSQDIADFVNNGGGLFGLTQSGFTDPYLYLGGIGGFTGNQGLDFSDITPLPDGTAIGITDDLDVCCWHDDFTEYPEFMKVLAVNPATGNAVALGGSNVIIGEPTTTTLAPTTTTSTTVVGPTTTTSTTVVGPTTTSTSTTSTTTPVQTTTTSTTTPIPATTTTTTTMRPTTTTTTTRPPSTTSTTLSFPTSSTRATSTTVRPATTTTTVRAVIPVAKATPARVTMTG